MRSSYADRFPPAAGPEPDVSDLPAPSSDDRTPREVVRAYLSVLEAGGESGNGVEKLRDRSRVLTERVEAEDDPLARLSLLQQRVEVGERLAKVEGLEDVADLAAAFVQVAGSYSRQRGISYAAWREVGVPARVLREAGITRGRTRP